MSTNEEYFKKVIRQEADNLIEQLDILDWGVMDKIVDLLCDVKKNNTRVVTSGSGTSGIAARKISHTLNVIEIPSFYLSPETSVHGGLGSIQKGDIVILLSKGGNTREMVDFIPMCRAKEAIVIGVTEAPDSVLGKDSDICLRIKVSVEPCPWNLIASGSILATISAWDAITFCVMEKTGFTMEQFYLTHPGGLVGDKLRESGYNTR